MEKLNLKAVSLTVALFFGAWYLICVGWCLLFPGYAMYQIWAPVIPGFKWLTLPSFIWGLVVSLFHGAVAGAVFVLIYNYVAGKIKRL